MENDERLPDELIIKIFGYLNKRDLCACSQVNRRWNRLTYVDSLWMHFSLNEMSKPKWCSSKLVHMTDTHYLITRRFSSHITHVDLAKLCFSFDTLDTLFQHCRHVSTLAINFKYLQVRPPNKCLVDDCIHTWPVNKLEKLYLKNVCDMKTRRYNQSQPQPNGQLQPYDIIELEIIKLIRSLFRRNSASLRSLGLKCVDPNVISACVKDFGNLEILLLNNINDTDSVLQEIAYVCQRLKCLELTKCREFQGDGLQELIDQCRCLETLQLGKQIYPAEVELDEVNWTNLKYQLKELFIFTKFPTSTHHQQRHHRRPHRHQNDHRATTTSTLDDRLNSDNSSNSSNRSSSSSSSSASSSSSDSSIGIYSSTIFNYLNDHNSLEYLALEDFTLRFPPHDHHHRNTNLNTSSSSSSSSSTSSISSNNKDEPSEKRAKADVNDDYENDSSSSSSSSRLKYLYLRNIRNIPSLTSFQLEHISLFLSLQFNLHTLDLIGISLKSDFICSILVGLNNLRVFNFGHGKSLSPVERYRSTRTTSNSSVSIDIDAINDTLVEQCPRLTHLGIFYRQSELEFETTSVNYENRSLMNLLRTCSSMREISYLKSFKFQDEERDETVSDQSNEAGEKSVSRGTVKSKTQCLKSSPTSKCSSSSTKSSNSNTQQKQYFRFIRYAIENASPHSCHVNMQPRYGYDITASIGCRLTNRDDEFLETTLPVIRPPKLDFHANLFQFSSHT